MITNSAQVISPVTHPGASPWQRFVRKITPYGFIAPFFLVFGIFQLLPIVFSVLLSLAEWNGMTSIQFVGLDNFVTMLQDPKFWNSLRVSLVITVVCTFLGTAGAVALAVLLEKVADRLASALRVIFFLPSVTSVVVITYIFKQLYNTDYGFFQRGVDEPRSAAPELAARPQPGDVLHAGHADLGRAGLGCPDYHSRDARYS